MKLETFLQVVTGAVTIVDDVESSWPATVVEKSNRYNSIINIIFCRIVQAFDNIVESLIEFENFTNLSVNANDVLLRGERVINSLYILCKCLVVSRYIFKIQYKGQTFSVTQGKWTIITLKCKHH